MNPSAAPASPPRILIVDDEEQVLETLHDILRAENYEVFAVTRPKAALEEIRNTEFAVILSDQRMPGMSGLELLAQAREIQPDATRILITAVLSLDTVIDAINKGEIYRFIIKPWLREEMLVAMQNAVQRYQLIRQNAHLQSAREEMNGKLIELNCELEEQVKLTESQNRQLAEMNDSLEQNLLRSMELCVQITQTFDPTLGNQVRRVFQISRAMCNGLNLPPDKRRALESAALLHDIGLVGVPRSVIKRWQEDAASLDEAEQSIIEQHPVLSQQMTGFGSSMTEVGAIIRAHHERIDGTGYPDRLSGEGIPWLARLLAVAVAFASSNLPHEEALQSIKLASGSAFDPEAVQALLKALDTAPVPRKEKQVQLAELQPGMVLARGIYNTKGMLLVPEGHQLNATYIEKLLNHNRVQPITQSLVVYC